MSYKMDKAEVIQAVEQFTTQIRETASKIGEESAFGFLFGQDHMIITAETVAHQVEQFYLTLKNNI